jgi:uncharacterized repeat protein (TIGR01451 family)
MAAFIAVVPAAAWPVAAAAAPLVDVTINIAGPATAGAGDPFSYTVRIGNNSLDAGDGSPFTVTMPTNAQDVAATCAAATGAACPAPLNVSNATVTGTVPTLPHLGEVTLTITGRFPVPSPSSETASAHIAPPPGATDPDPTSNDSSVSTAINNTADLAVTKTQSSPTIAAGSPETYTVTYTDNGPAAADGAAIQDQLNWLANDITGMRIHMLSCAATAGAVCPELPADTTMTSGNFPLRTTTPTFPVGSAITVMFTADPVLSAPCVASAGSVTNYGMTQVPAGMTDPVSGNNLASVKATLTGPACPQADLAATKTQSSPVTGPGAPETYTITYTNNGPGAADGASLLDSMSFDGSAMTGMNIHMVSCTPAGGAACPELPADATIGPSGLPLRVTAGALPAGSSMVIVFTADPVVPSGCLPANEKVSNTAAIYAPAGVTDPVNGNNSANVTAGPSLLCPPADLSVTKAQSRPTIAPGLPDTYTLTFANNGPNSADGASINDYMPWTGTLIAGIRIHVASCTATGGAVCPAPPADTTISNNQFAVRLPVPTFPSGSSVTVTVTADPVPGTTGCGSPGQVNDTGSVYAPNTVTDPNNANNSATVTTPVACADVAVNKVVDPAATQAFQPVSFQVKVADSSPGGVASGVLFSDPLPSGFVFGSATCSANSAASTCGPVSYDPGTRTVSSTITQVGGNQDFVTITISGTAGPVPGTYANTASALPPTSAPDAFYDPNLASNTSTVSLQVFNTASAINVTKVLTGWPAGLPTAVTFTGEVTCGTQGSRPWQATVPAGADEADALSVTISEADFTGTGTPPAATCPTADLAPREQLVCTASYTVTQADVDAGTLTNTAHADGTSPGGTTATSDPSTITLPQAANPALTLVKTAAPAVITAAGELIHYTYVITNTGNLTLTGVGIAEKAFTGTGATPVPDCPGAPVTLLPGQFVTCTAVYPVTGGDLSAKTISNTAAATGVDPGDTTVTSPDSTVTRH